MAAPFDRDDKSQLEGGSRSFPCVLAIGHVRIARPDETSLCELAPGQSAAPSSECRSTLITRMRSISSDSRSIRTSVITPPPALSWNCRRLAHPRAPSGRALDLAGPWVQSRYPTHRPSAESVHGRARQTDEGEAQLISWSPASTLVQSSTPGPPDTTAAAEPGRFRPSSSPPC